MSVAQRTPRSRGTGAQGDGPDRMVEARTSVRARENGALRVVVVADTHGRPHPSSAEHIAKVGPDAILHAGDIGDLKVLDGLRKIAPVVAVRGNIDGRGPELPDVVIIDVESAQWPLRVLLTHIALYGPKLRADAVRRAEQSGASLVVCGHSHVPFIGRDRDLLVFNPGSMGPRRFHLPIVFGVLELSAGGLDLRHVDCETGARWTPGSC